MSETDSPSSRPTKPEMTFRLLERKLHELLPSRAQDIHLSDRFETIIPTEDRRRVWRELKLAGLILPDLTVPRSELQRSELWGCLLCPIVLILGFPFLFAALVTKALGFTFVDRILSTVFNRIFLLTRVNEELAIYSPAGCETVQEAVLDLTPFRFEDYKAGLWPPEEIGAKVRHIISEHSGVSFDEIKNDSRWGELE